MEFQKYSFKSCGRDSGHGGSEQEESPRSAQQTKFASLRFTNNNIATTSSCSDRPNIVNPFSAAAATLEHTSPPNHSTILPDYRLAGDISSLRYGAIGSLPGSRLAHRNHSPWNHTYTEISDAVAARGVIDVPDPVYEEIEKGGRRMEVQVSDTSDEDGRRQNSDISRQSSRSYGDHRPLLPYTLPSSDHRNCASTTAATISESRIHQSCLRHPEGPIHLPLSDNHIYHTRHVPQTQHCHHHHRIATPLQSPEIDHTIVSAGHMLPLVHPNLYEHHCPSDGITGQIRTPLEDQRYQEAISSHHQLGQSTVVQPLSEPNLRNWEAVQRHKDLQQLQQHLGEMTVAVLNGEQVVCKLKSPLAPIHENSSSQATTVATANAVSPMLPGSIDGNHYLPQQHPFNHC